MSRHTHLEPDELGERLTHELLGPLTSIIGYAELLDDELTGQLSVEQQHFLDAIGRNSALLRDRIQALLDTLE